MACAIKSERSSGMAMTSFNINKKRITGGLLLSIEKLRREKSPDDVLDMITQIPFNDRPPRVLTIQGTCMQLSNREWKLSDIEACYRRALKIEPDYVDAMIELAYFLDVIMNEPRKAIYWFRRARRVTRYFLKEIEDGIKNVGDSFAIQ